MPPNGDGEYALGSIKRYWANIEQLMPDKNLAVLETIQRKIESSKFRDATEYNPVRAVDFVGFLDCEFLDLFLAKYYPRIRKSEKIKSRIMAKVRFVAYMALSRAEHILSAYNSLSDEDFEKLGFFERPSYESLREFINDKLGNDGLQELHRYIIERIVHLAESYGIEIGKRIGEDATDIRALKHDPEADYSGYYKEYGYKVDFVADMDNGTLILHFTPMSINSNEGDCLIPSIECLRDKGIKPEYIVCDDKYATYKNIGYCGVHGIDMVYKIAKNWKENSNGSIDSLYKRYQKYHREDDWVPEADIGFMLWYLYKKGDYDYTGAYYRNHSIERYTSEPEDYLSLCHERSGKIEGMNGYLKSHTNLDHRPVRRGWKGFVRHVIYVVLSQAFAALIRLQNGITENLTNLTYII